MSENANVDVGFELVEVTEAPTRTFTKGSMYDKYIAAFLKCGKKMVELKVKAEDGKKEINPEYLRTQLNKRIKATEEKRVSISVTNGKVYMHLAEAPAPA